VQAQLEKAWRSLLDLDGAVLTIAENSGPDSEQAKRLRADRDRASEKVKSLSRRLRTLLPGDAGERAVQTIEAAQAKALQDELAKLRAEMQGCEEVAADLAKRLGPTHQAVTSRQADRDRLKRRVEAFEKRLAGLSLSATQPATRPATSMPAPADFAPVE
jgi:chromosome segregation ATPase